MWMYSSKVVINEMLDIANTLRTGAREFGFSFDNLKLDYSVAVKRSRQVSNRLVKGIGFLMKKNNIDVIMGTGRITEKNKITVTGEDGTTQEVVPKHQLLQTGDISNSRKEIDGEKSCLTKKQFCKQNDPNR